MKNKEWLLIVLCSATFLLASWQKLVPFSLLETWGFLTGAACVYLVVRENIWNFPIGIANNVFFFILFYQSHIFGDAGLQILYLILGLQGWYEWLYGGKNRTTLPIRRAPLHVLGLCVASIIVSTYALMQLLHSAKGAAPLLDSLTTSISLGAQVLLNYKFIENWWFWIVADIFYIYLYYSRGLPLTAVLYTDFIGLCFLGLAQWNRGLNECNSVKIA